MVTMVFIQPQQTYTVGVDKKSYSRSKSLQLVRLFLNLKK